MWQKAVGNELELTENSFKAALARAKNKEIQLKEQNGSFVGQNQRERDWFNAIRRDAKATFPELRIFQPEGPLHDSLLEVLMAYSMYRSDVGYTYGTHVGLIPSPLLCPRYEFRTDPVVADGRSSPLESSYRAILPGAI